MSAPHRSAISWTDYSGGDANFVTGCTPVSEGCRNCYARGIYERFGRDFGTVNFDAVALCRLAKWRPRPPWKGERPMCFVCDTGDLFHEHVHLALIDAAFETMVQRPDVIWQVLTKRPERMVAWWGQTYGYLPDNIWLGVSVENQARADERVPLLLQMPAPVCFLSVEPMLGPIDLSPWLPWLDWIICGAESGPNRREFDVQWAVDLNEQCREAGVPFFYKQGSALRPGFNVHLPGYGVVQEWPRV